MKTKTCTYNEKLEFELIYKWSYFCLMSMHFCDFSKESLITHLYLLYNQCLTKRNQINNYRL